MKEQVKVLWDAGHGGNSTGKCSPPFVKKVTQSFKGRKITILKGERLKEHCANAAVAAYSTAFLETFNYEVIKSGWKDALKWQEDICPDNANTDVRERQKKAKPYKCNISVSGHFNADGSDGQKFTKANGYMILVRKDLGLAGYSKELANCILKRMAKEFPTQKNLGIVYGDWGMCNVARLGLKDTNLAAAVIVECSFMTNQFEAENYFCSPRAWYKYARAISYGINDYVNIRQKIK